MRRLVIEFCFEVKVPQILASQNSLVIHLGSEMSCSDIESEFGDKLSAEEWQEFRLLWSRDEFEGRKYELLQNGHLRVTRR